MELFVCIRNIRLDSTLPAFGSPNVRNLISSLPFFPVCQIDPLCCQHFCIADALV